MVIFIQKCIMEDFSTTPLQVEIQVNKTLTHEQYTFADPSFLDEVVLVAGVDASFTRKWTN